MISLCMKFQNFDKLESRDVRKYWESERRDFTPALAEDIEEGEASQLEDVLGLDLEVVDTEKSVGRYQLDILAETEDGGRTIVIENQLTDSDHPHFGKTMAYAAGVGADVIVWIAPEFHDEHKDAVQWLNKNTREGIDFFCIKLEVWKIGESGPAVRFEPVVQPSEWTRRAQRAESELTETKRMQEEFWTELRDRIKQKDTPLRPRTPEPHHWYSNPIGKTGFNLSFTFNSRENKIYCLLLIRDDAEAYQALRSEREDIESIVGADVDWVPPSETDTEKERAKIRVSHPANLKSREDWDDYLAWIIKRGEEFHEAFYDRVQSL